MVSKSASKPPHPSSSSSSPRSPADKQRFKGVRMRSWGKWVSEIRLPNTRARLWLGSYTTAEQAARAFDVAVVCLRGRSVALNFPDSPPTYAPLGLPHHQIQELAAAAATNAAPSAAPSSCESTVRPNSDESDASTISYSSRSDESVAATTNEMSSSSCCCSSSSDDSATFAGLLELDEDSEQSSPLDAALREHALNMGSEWDEQLWGYPMTGYLPAWEEPLLLLPPFPTEDDDLPTIVEPSLWSI